MVAPFASLDLGTNTFRLLIAESAVPSGAYRPIQFDREITRAGGGYTDAPGLSSDAEDRALACLSRFSAAMQAAGVERYQAVATSVFRKAVNGPEVLARLESQTGIHVEVISGDHEAELSAEGAVSQVSLAGPAVVFDIGGGSTEYVVWDRGVEFRESLDFGVVRLAEDVLSSDPPSTGDLGRLAEAVDAPISTLALKVLERLGGRPFELVGTAGTVSTLGAVDLALQTYDRERINGHRLERCFIADNFERFAVLDRRGRLAVEGMEPGREDLIVPGCYIALRTVEALNCGQILISEGGLLEGVMSRLVAGAKPSASSN